MPVLLSKAEHQISSVYMKSFPLFIQHKILVFQPWIQCGLEQAHDHTRTGGLVGVSCSTPHSYAVRSWLQALWVIVSCCFTDSTSFWMMHVFVAAIFKKCWNSVRYHFCHSTTTLLQYLCQSSPLICCLCDGVAMTIIKIVTKFHLCPTWLRHRFCIKKFCQLPQK